ncbi:phosphoribosyl-ATP pyrophosphohydrolase [Lactobacillus helveticus]|uniref:nucleoside triphosphate pyrophosphohydrolase n=1 Tax=Lactobacillus helveticus TaxID=1587 RepID=UPI001C64F308|nr:nucleoside triphosphate pyrophosphohydrolase [Lactobacillus helveticus]MBW8013615.1 phosphoribosyl-ATP pyrophosphohydrolase [Lactobacillus helveticus]
MKKLVRNKIPRFAPNAKYIKLAPNEIELALKDKIVEEALEVKTAPNDQNLIEELGDVYSVLEAFLNYKKIDKKLFLKKVAEKNREKGTFSEYLLMETNNNDK